MGEKYIFVFHLWKRFVNRSPPSPPLQNTPLEPITSKGYRGGERLTIRSPPVRLLHLILHKKNAIT